MRIKKVDLFAKGLRSFATFTEAAVPGSASRCDSGKGISCRGNEVVALQTSAILLPRLLTGSRDAASFCDPPQAFQRRGNEVVALRSSAFLQPETHTWIPGPQSPRDKKNAHGIPVGICLIFEPTVISLMMIVKGLTII